MPTKPKVVDETGGNHDLQLFYDSYMSYIDLSRYLFGAKNPIYDINEMPPKSKFYKAARDIAATLSIDWETMTHEQSNRIMLALLEDTYKAMAEVDAKNKKSLVIELTLKVKASDKQNKKTI